MKTWPSALASDTSFLLAPLVPSRSQAAASPSLPPADSLNPYNTGAVCPGSGGGISSGHHITCVP